MKITIGDVVLTGHKPYVQPAFVTSVEADGTLGVVIFNGPHLLDTGAAVPVWLAPGAWRPKQFAELFENMCESLRELRQSGAVRGVYVKIELSDDPIEPYCDMKFIWTGDGDSNFDAIQKQVWSAVRSSDRGHLGGCISLSDVEADEEPPQFPDYIRIF